MAYSVPDLGYAFDALEPHIDARTMEIHHDKHHAAYVTNLNAALEGTGLDDQPVEQLIANLGQVPEDKRTAVRNNGGGHANHTLFWELMAPGGATGPSGALAAAVDAFGGLDALKAAVNDAGVKRFGSGWSWVVRDGDGLSVTSTPNQDSPVMDGAEPGARRGRLGARLLPQLPEPATGLPRRLVERRQLGRRRREVRRGRLSRLTVRAAATSPAPATGTTCPNDLPPTSRPRRPRRIHATLPYVVRMWTRRSLFGSTCPCAGETRASAA